ncbi:MAG: hypothetical protein ACJ8C4_14275 [Gemmataceae bacterium]
MPDLCAGLGLFAIAAFAFAALGHSLWLVGSALFRHLFHPDSDKKPSREPINLDRRRCPRCDVFFSGIRRDCPQCGLDPNSPLGRELSELEGAARNLQKLIDRGTLDQATSEAVYQAIEARQNELLRKPPKEPAVVAELWDADPATLPPIHSNEPIISPPTPQIIPEPMVPPTPRPPRRTLGEVLAAFMEERNILWGELVGGLLIVGCSIALVISLWQTLQQQIHYFPFFVFAGLTLALFGAGRYTLSHWKLASTSRGLLVIATMLTPLNFVVLAGLSRGRPSGPIDWGLEIASLAVFALIIRWSSRVTLGPLHSESRWVDSLAALAIVGTAGSQLLVPRSLDLEAPSLTWLVTLGLLPAGLQILALTPILWSLARRDRIEANIAPPLLMTLGQAAFATAVALAFLVYWSSDRVQTVQQLAVPLAVSGLPLLLCGALLHARLTTTSEATSEDAISPVISRWMGTAASALGAAILLAALALAWSRAPALIGLGLGEANLFIALAGALRMPAVQIPAAVCLTIGGMTLLHQIFGVASPTDSNSLLWYASPEASVSWLILAGMFLFISEALAWAGKQKHGVYHAISAGLAGLAAMVALRMEPTSRSAVVFGICWLGTWAQNIRWRKPWLTAVGSVIAIGFAVFLAHQLAPERSWPQVWAMALTATAICLLTISLLLEVFWRNEGEFIFAQPMRIVSVFVGVIAFAPLVVSIEWASLSWCAWMAGALATFWLVASLRTRSPHFYVLAQATVVAAILLGVSRFLSDQAWVDQQVANLFHIWSVQYYTLALAALTATWSIMRIALRRRFQSAVDDQRSVFWECTGLVCVLILHTGVLIKSAWLPVLSEMAPVGEWQNFANQNLAQGQLHLAALTLLALSLTALLWFWCELPGFAVVALMAIALNSPLLVAQMLADDRAAATALRWSIAGIYLLAALAVWSRGTLYHAATRLGVHGPWHAARRDSRMLLILFGVIPVLALTSWLAARAFQGAAIPGPLPNSFFDRLGFTCNALGPLLLLILGLTGTGVRENKAGYIFSAGQLTVFSVAGGYALRVVLSGRTIDVPAGMTILLLTSLTSGLWQLAWLITGRWRSQPLLFLQAVIGIVGGGFVLAITLSGIVSHDKAPVWGTIFPTLVRPLGWMSWFVAATAVVWTLRLLRPTFGIHGIATAGVGLAILAGAAAQTRWPGSWAGYHLLTLCGSVLAIVVLTLAWWADVAQGIGPGLWSAERRTAAAKELRAWFPAHSARRWVNLLALCVFTLALAGGWRDPGRPYVSSVALLAVAILFGALGVWEQKPHYAYAACFMLNVVAYLVWQSWLIDRFGLHEWFPRGPGVTDRLVLMEILAFCAASIAWSFLENWSRRRVPPMDLRGSGAPVSHVTAMIALHILVALVATALVSDWLNYHIQLQPNLAWSAVGVVAAAFLVQLWDPQAAEWGIPGVPLYVIGLSALALGILLAAMPAHNLPRAVLVSASAYVLIISVLARLAPRLNRVLGWLGVKSLVETRLAGWFVPAQTVVSAAAIVLGLWITVTFPTRAERLAGPLATSLIVVASIVAVDISALALRAGLSTRIAVAALLCATLGGTELTWALLDEATPAPWLHRMARLLAVLTSAFAIASSRCGGIISRKSLWSDASRLVSAPLVTAAAITLTIVLGQEVALYDRVARTTPLGRSEILLVSFLLFAVVISAIWGALSPPNATWTVRNRKGLVWLAELLFGLLLLHLRLNVPDLFPAFFGRHWHFTMMGVAFVAVILSETFRRRDVAVLAQPLYVTALLLPSVPLIAFGTRPVAYMSWMTGVAPGLDPLIKYLEKLPNDPNIHATLWFLLGNLYGLLGVMRRSSAYALAGAMAGNFGLWVLFSHHPSLAFALHPQLWLAPVGLILLAAEALNRDRLPPETATAMRYVAALLIYVSSSADMFISGLGNSVILPIVLVVLAIVGVLAGILMRVRGLLFMGVAFLALDVFAQIWHAAYDRQQTWVWWASGIFLGATILALFAVFEKRRNDVLRLVAEIRSWD